MGLAWTPGEVTFKAHRAQAPAMRYRLDLHQHLAIFRVRILGSTLVILRYSVAHFAALFARPDFRRPLRAWLYAHRARSRSLPIPSHAIAASPVG
jgi:hypothetical protein